MTEITDSTTKLLDKFTSVGDFSKLQIHVIFNYMPFTKKINETEAYNQIAQETVKNSNSDDFIKNMINNPNNKFNFTIDTNDKVFLLDSHITKNDLETLLPELNKKIENDDKLKASEDKLKASELKAINENDTDDKRGGTRITKRQKKTPPKKNKHHTARKQT